MHFSALLLSLFLIDGPVPQGHEAKARAFVTALAKGDFEAASKDFDDAVKKALPKDKLESLWRTLQEQVGKFESQGQVRSEKQDAYQIIYITCEFKKNALDIRLVFNKQGQIGGLSFRPAESSFTAPPYAKKDSFRESAVTIGTGEWQLPGTLTMPKGDGPFPAVVLVHGSGPQDRDETIGQAKPLRDLAWGLASKGIAALRYEKRTKEHGAQVVKLPNFSVKEETIDDALLGAALLRKTPGVDGKRVYIVGHSLGAMMAPRMALADGELAGIVLMAAPSRTLVVLILEQTERELKTAKSEQEKKLLTTLRTIAEKLRDGKVTADTPRSELMGSNPGYWLEFRDYKAPADAAKVTQRMLILQGEADTQVTMEDFAGWKKVAANWKNAALKSYPKLSHLFIDPSEKDQHVSERVIADLAGWIKTSSSPGRD
jgi:dienelactone hydrolase